MPRDLVLDFRVGGGSVPEVAHGIVRIWGTEVRPNGPSVVVTTETTLKLSNGKATLANAQTSGTGPLYEWAYIIQVEPFHGRNFRFYVAIPDGTTPINLVDLPKLNPNTGEGFYLDIEEWEALYGDLPNRVDMLEDNQAVLQNDVADLKVLGGLATGDVNDATTANLIETEGTQTKTALSAAFVGKGELVINAKDYVVGNGVADDTLGLQAAANAAKAAKIQLWVPSGVRILITSPVDMRYIDIRFDGFLTVAATAQPYGVIVGDSSQVRVSRDIRFNSAYHQDRVTQTNVCVRVQGVMAGTIYMGRCDYFQIYANATEEPSTGHASAYSTYIFTGGSIKHLELLGEGGHSWINENLFIGGDFRRITIGGTYTHSSNTFIKPSIEGAGSLVDIQRGARNKFINARGEYDPHVKFGKLTWHNVITDGFWSTPTSKTSRIIVDSDEGVENVVETFIDAHLEPHNIFSLDAGTPMYDTARSYPGTSVTPGFRKLKVVSNFQSVVKSGLLPVASSAAWLRRIRLRSDAALWRPIVRVYGENRVQLNPDTWPYMETDGGWAIAGTSPDRYYFISGGSSEATILLLSKSVHYVSIEIQSSGGSAGASFESLSIDAYRQGAESPRLIETWARGFNLPLFGAVPTQGLAQVGTVVNNATGSAKCTYRSDMALSSGRAEGSAAIPVANTAGIAVGDTVGILLTDGTTHWTKVSLVASGTAFNITNALPSPSYTAAPVALSRWV